MAQKTYGYSKPFKRKDGRWQSYIYVTLVNGEQKRKPVILKSHKALLIRMRELQERENRRIPYSEKDWTVAEYLDYWMHNIQRNRIRETTSIVYGVMIKKHIKPTLGEHKIRNLCVYNIRCALDLMKERGCSERVRLECVRVLSACLNCAMREEVIFRNVAQLVEKPRYIPKETVIWTTEEAAHFLKEIKNHPQYIAFLLLLVYGLRRGEVLGLRWCDIDFNKGMIHVRQQIDRINGEIKVRDLKTKNSRREIPLRNNVRTALLEHAKLNGVNIPPFDPHFEMSTTGTVVLSRAGTPLEPRSLAKSFNILAKKAGLPCIKLHAMRHMASTILKDLGVPMKDTQLLIGHAEISTTVNYYQHGTLEAQRTAISDVEEALLPA